MYESTNAIAKDSGHQLLNIVVTHLHYLAPECAKYCSKRHLMDMFQYNVYLFIQ